MQIVDRSTALAIAPIWRLGFRPFFLAGAAFSVIAVALWGALLNGWVTWQPVGGALAWHRHEMLFGFAIEIIAGFLLTAAQNWTGRPGLSGRPLMALVALWLLGRIAWLVAPDWRLLALVQLSFLPLVAFAVGRMVYAARQRRNYPVVLILMLLWACQVSVFAGLATGDEGMQRRGALAALWLIGALLAMIGGRVIPFFTQRGLGLADALPSPAWLDRGVLVCSLGAALSMALGLNDGPRWSMAPLFMALAVLHLYRLSLWYRRGIWAVPLLWSLHLAYAWLAIAALGMAAWHEGLPISPSLPAHALAVGALAGLVLAMTCRVSLGHTGRPLQVPLLAAWAFAALQVAALCRVVLVLFSQWGLLASVGLWCVAFGLFLWLYVPILTRARIDGLPG
ncbi:NnrS family protein [Pseudomonas sp. LRF_L74]|uniref:NnrS family protein n=1 Tax=Pseudomonas sp. LRF_L74 TaxID=3369422 RepID=UPI003F5D8618